MHGSVASPPMDTSQWPKCPTCGLPNIPERSVCKRCRATLRFSSVLAPPTAATQATGRLYTSADAHHQLFVSSSFLEYAGPGITIRTAWGNIDSLRVDRVEAYLWLRVSATVVLIRSSDPTLDAWREHTVPLHCFGYPANSDLLADLRCFAPYIWPDHRPQQRR
jgi:hypothetical protein